jgi:hypothetical protein
VQPASGPSGPTGPEASMFTLLHMLGLHTLIALGEIPSPLGKEKGVDLRQAKFHLDTVRMLKEKTEGNLDEAESQAIENLLGQLEAAYDKKSQE